MKREEIINLSSSQTEADTKIILHISKISSVNVSSVLIKATDTDIFVILLENLDKMRIDKTKICKQLGSGKATRIVNISNMYEKLGNNVAKALPGMHAFTGSDFTPSFYKKGKRTCVRKLMSSPIYQDAFIKLGDVVNLSDSNVFQVLEKYVCDLNGYAKFDDVNAVRYEIFQKTYVTQDEKFLQQLKTYDACQSELPLCKSELRQQILRAAFVTSI